MAHIKVQIPTFDGSESPLKAREFIACVDRQLNLAGNALTDARMAQLVQDNLRGIAATWCANNNQEGLAAMNTWATLKPIFRLRFCAPLNMDQLTAMERALQQKPAETAVDFYERCRAYTLEVDANLTQEEKDEATYPVSYHRRIAFKFAGGLREEVRKAMVDVDVLNATDEQLLAAAKRAEVRLMSATKAGAIAANGSAPSTLTAGQLSAILAAVPDLPPDARGLIAALTNGSPNNPRGRGNGRGRRGNRGRGGNGRGNQGNQGNAPNANAYNPNQGAGNPNRRPRTWCRYHQRDVAHAERDCFLRPGNQPSQGFPAGGASRGRGSYAAAISGGLEGPGGSANHAQYSHFQEGDFQ
jgi:hypothetical protein